MNAPKVPRCRCGEARLLNHDGEGICYDCFNSLVEVKNNLVRENYDLHEKVKGLQEMVRALNGSATAAG